MATDRQALNGEVRRGDAELGLSIRSVRLRLEWKCTCLFAAAAETFDHLSVEADGEWWFGA